MPYTFPVDARELIAERAGQWISLGIEPTLIERMRGRLSDVWSDQPGGWVHEWSAAAERAEQAGDPLRASLLYGVAKFPVLGNKAHVTAYENQLRTFLAASGDFPVPFERHQVEVTFRDEIMRVPTYLYQPPDVSADAPLLLLLSGVDTWKVELHGIAVAAAQLIGTRVITLDMAGTGESPVPNGPDGDLYLLGVLDWLRGRFPRARRAGALGFSFGGHWTTKLALTRKIDAAVNVGASVDAAFTPEHLARARFGMAGILGNSLHLDTAPTASELAAALAPFSLRRQGLFDDWGTEPVPLLVVNGDNDQHVPLADTTVFRSRPNTTVRLEPGAGHVAAEALGELIPWMLRWLHDQLHR
jgi:esterase FrsA